jgi:hypothetical protein
MVDYCEEQTDAHQGKRNPYTCSAGHPRDESARKGNEKEREE